MWRTCAATLLKSGGDAKSPERVYQARTCAPARAPCPGSPGARDLRACAMRPHLAETVRELGEVAGQVFPTCDASGEIFWLADAHARGRRRGVWEPSRPAPDAQGGPADVLTSPPRAVWLEQGRGHPYVPP